MNPLYIPATWFDALPANLKWTGTRKEILVDCGNSGTGIYPKLRSSLDAANRGRKYVFKTGLSPRWPSRSGAPAPILPRRRYPAAALRQPVPQPLLARSVADPVA